MKIALRGAVAAIALTAAAGAAQAQTHSITNPVSEQVTSTVSLGPPGFYKGQGNSAVSCTQGTAGCNFNATGPVGTQVETAFTISGSAADNTVAATPSVSNAFTLQGNVSRDCSFYAGNTEGARTINFGTIGVRTGNNENVNAAFEMAGPATATVNTLTAGCNTNNTVSISKNDIRGMVNSNPGGYDTNQFQAHIPYSVTASWTGVAINAQTTGSAQGFSVPTTGNAGSVQQGAWRSAMNIEFNAPAITDKGLVAGDYSGTTTVTLTAL
jgi:hypothetical protein